MADGNPFDSYQGQQHPSDPYASQGPPGNAMYPPQHPPPPPHNQGYGMPPQQQQQQWMQQQPPPQPQESDPFGLGSPQPPPQQPQGYNNALIPSAQPSNPYAGYAPNQGMPASPGYGYPDPNSQAMVPVAPNAAGNPYPGAPSPQQQYQQHPAQQMQDNYGQDSMMDSNFSSPPPASRPVREVDIVPAPSNSYPGAPPPTEGDEVKTPTGKEARNKYAGELAQNAPLGASPLPRADMVRKTGYVLSRISFRTIVMKKWKQSFWVQYGPHTMLWFRSQSDFDDWLNNPYHTQAQRNFLIKLAVNFAHDLYKPNVRGYQVTQCRTKSYGTKLIRQFKLERWMDYGPTIAAAFGSNNPKEVDDLREALVACMRNTPLNGGIRATGAVRERTEGDDPGAPGGSEGAGYHGSASYAGHQNMGRPASRSVASASELGMDNKGFDDTNSDGGMPSGSAPPPVMDLLDAPSPQPQQPLFHEQPNYGQPMPPQQQQAQYPPGNPQMMQYQGQQQPFQQQPPQPYGAPPPQVQNQYPPQPGQQPAFGGY